MDVPGCRGCAALRELVEHHRAEIAALKGELAAAKKDSSNSSKPPSSDFVKKPKNKPKDGKKRKRGGQPGHPRHEREPFADQDVSYLELHCHECPDCHGPVVLSKEPPKILQQVDLHMPSAMISVVGFRSHACWCKKCRQVHYAPIDEAARRAGLIGPRLTTLIAYLKSACHCSYSTIRKFIRDVLGIKISRGHLAKLITKAGASLQDAYAALAKQLPSEPQVNVDETGHKDYSTSLWTWCFRASLFTLFKISPSRGSDVLVDMLGQEFNGILGCDYFSAYRKYMKDFGVLVQFCLAHFLRDVRFLVEQAIRFVVIDRKVTQGTRGDKGQRWLERIWTVLATCAQTDRNVFGFLYQSLSAFLAGQPTPRLLPDSS